MDVNSTTNASASYLNTQSLQRTADSQPASTALQQLQTQGYQQPPSDVQNSQPADKVNISSTVTVKNLDTVRAIEQMNARMNQLAKGARETNEEINKAVEQVNAMQSNLTAIVKNFPPFPMESKERQELLMSYSSIRQELMRMTVPQPPPPLYEQVKHEWDKTVGQNGQMLASAVPALDTGSSDAQVKQTAAQLETFSTSLADLSSGVTKALISG